MALKFIPDIPGLVVTMKQLAVSAGSDANEFVEWWKDTAADRRLIRSWLEIYATSNDAHLVARAHAALTRLGEKLQ
jgi:hypothetical protein